MPSRPLPTPADHAEARLALAEALANPRLTIRDHKKALRQFADLAMIARQEREMRARRMAFQEAAE